VVKEYKQTEIIYAGKLYVMQNKVNRFFWVILGLINCTI